MPTLLFSSPEDPVDLWVPGLRAAMPDVEVRAAPDCGDLAEIDYALVWKPVPGFLASLPNLRLIMSIAAGVDHILADPALPELPIVRMSDAYLTAMMAEYAVLGVLHFHRYMPEYQAEQGQAVWHRRWPRYTPESIVGVLGLGAIGAEVARKLAALEFPVHGWSRTAKTLPGITCHHGEDGLAALLAQSQYLVCVLPLTGETRGIINAKSLAALPQGAAVINLARGGHVVDDDLLAALESGHISGAFLDVFNEEPLPPAHPYWRHPKVVMTPHVAGEIVPRSAAKAVAETIRRDQAGEPLLNLYKRDVGY